MATFYCLSSNVWPRRFLLHWSVMFIICCYSAAPCHSASLLPLFPEEEEEETLVQDTLWMEPNYNQTPPSSLDTDTNEDYYIRGGSFIDALPWFFVFQSRTLCGGSLIWGDIALTAAHCVDDNGWPKAIRIGSSDYYNGGIVVNVDGGAIHEEWGWGRRPSDPDLAILKLRDYLPNQPTVRLNRNPLRPTPDHEAVFTMGFGLYDDTHTSRFLLGAAMPYLDDCSKQSQSFNQTRHLCADSRTIATCGGTQNAENSFGCYSLFLTISCSSLVSVFSHTLLLFSFVFHFP
jgi:hypothetical protein